MDNEAEATSKAIGQFNMRVGAVLGQFFHIHGLDVYIPPAKAAIELHALELHKRLKEIEHDMS